MSTKTTFRRLAGLPPYGPMAIGFPKEWARFGSEGIVVEFTQAGGATWVGNFCNGIGGAVDIRWHPNGTHVLVVANGALWCVDPVARTADELAPAIFGITELECGDLLLDDQGLAFVRLGPAGIVWWTRRISWDGFRKVRREAERLVGEAWSPTESCWLSFSVDLGSGQVDGGSYNGPEMYLRPSPVQRPARRGDRTMERRALEASWAKTREHLARAHAALDIGGTAPEIRADVVECIDEYIDELIHNELELAMDALAEAALRSLSASAVWQALECAAISMGLENRAEEFRRRAQSKE